ncbi:MAG: hypothetical protein KBC44_00285 [Candidatus Pacebacteria bacterium]|nr:hypothetical protein [Candidatus Paceibacterota bacterium]MBP9839404.1 hypothetical protein [Candidatus Paceibacterota bacterium]
MNYLKDSDPDEIQELLNTRLLKDIKKIQKEEKRKNKPLIKLLREIREIWIFMVRGHLPQR